MTTHPKQLLCTFSRSDIYQSCIRSLVDHYTIVDKKIFVFVNQNKLSELYLTFNVPKNDIVERYKDTISIHRKKQTNTLYTLNAMNKLIADENNGVYDRSFQLDWNLYRDSIILTHVDGVKVVTLKLFSIVPV